MQKTQDKPRISAPFRFEPIKSQVKIIAVCEALPENKYVTNVVEAFKSAGIKVKNIGDIVKKGVYLTVAVKEPRKGLIVPSDIIEKYSYDLEEELKTFPNTKAILLMGDAAIKALNYISRRRSKTRVIPAGSTYKIRGGKFYFGNIRVFPSYLPTGKNFLIEKSKQRMVADDIRNAFKLLR